MKVHTSGIHIIHAPTPSRHQLHAPLLQCLLSFEGGQKSWLLCYLRSLSAGIRCKASTKYCNNLLLYYKIATIGEVLNV